MAGQLCWYLGETCGFELDPDGLENPDNAHLGRVLARRSGLPITLAVVYLWVARRVGVRAEGVNFPGYFLVRVGNAADACLLDPGAARLVLPSECESHLRATLGEDVTLDPARHLGAADTAAIAVRMLNNHCVAAAGRSDLLTALRYSSYVSALVPQELAPYRDRAGWYEALRDLDAAVQEYGALLQLVHEPALRRRIEARIRSLSGPSDGGPIH